MDCSTTYIEWHAVGRDHTHSSQEAEWLCSMVFLLYYTYPRVFNFPSKKCRQSLTIWVNSQTSLLLLSLHGCYCKPFSANDTSYFHRREVPEVHNFRREPAPHLQAFLHWPSVLSRSTAVSVKEWFLPPSTFRMEVPVLKFHLYV